MADKDTERTLAPPPDVQQLHEHVNQIERRVRIIEMKLGIVTIRYTPGQSHERRHA